MIFEKRQFTDGGPNDKGKVIGFIEAETKEDANKILNINHGFIQVFEISNEDFQTRFQKVKNEMKMFMKIEK